MTAAAGLDANTTIQLFIGSIGITIALFALFTAMYGRAISEARTKLERLNRHAEHLRLVAETTRAALSELVVVTEFQRGLIHRALDGRHDPMIAEAMALASNRQRPLMKSVLELSILETHGTVQESAARRLSDELGDARSLRVLEFELQRLKRKGRGSYQGVAVVERAIADLRARLSETP